MKYNITCRSNSVDDAITLSMSAKANLLASSGRVVYNLSAGAPQVDTPEHIKEAAKLALDQGKTKYSIVQGEIMLRKAIVDKLEKENQLFYDIDNVVISNGVKQSLYIAIQALIEPGDEVIIHSPYWLSFPDIVRLAGGIPVFIETHIENNYKFTHEDLQKFITPKTKLLIFNSPSNPTGGVYTRKEMLEIADVIVKNNILVISDEIFEKIIYGETPHISIASLNEEIFKRTIVVNGFSKIYSMTGWRVGYMAAPKEISAAVTRTQSHLNSNVCTFAQYGSFLCYTDDRSKIAVENFMQLYRKNRKIIVDMLNDIDGVTCLNPESTFYVYPDVSELKLASTTLCMKLLEQEGVAGVPGIAFGSDKNIRFLFATKEETIVRGMEGFKRFVERL